jgi:hypothetical protein
MMIGDHFRKLKSEDILAIRFSDEKTKIIAEKYKINPRYVRKIKQGIVWKFLS